MEENVGGGGESSWHRKQSSRVLLRLITQFLDSLCFLLSFPAAFPTFVHVSVWLPLQVAGEGGERVNLQVPSSEVSECS